MRSFAVFGMGCRREGWANNSVSQGKAGLRTAWQGGKGINRASLIFSERGEPFECLRTQKPVIFFRQIQQQLDGLQPLAMRTALICCMLAILGLVGATVTPKLYISPIEHNFKPVGNQWWSYQPQCYGGSGRYYYSWSNLPSGWSDIAYKDYSGYDNTLFLPYNVQNGRYQVGVSVYDLVYRIELKTYIILQINLAPAPATTPVTLPYSYSSSDILSFTREKYDDDFDYGSSYNFETKDIVVLPSWSKITMLIEDGDIVEIRQIINRVIQSDNECSQKKDFLNGVLSRIDDFLSKSTNSIAQLKASITSLQSTISAYQSRLSILIKERNYNGLSKLKAELNDVLVQLAFYEKKIAENKASIVQYEFEIKSLNAYIWNIKDVTLVALAKEIAQLKVHAAELTYKIQLNVGDVPWWEYELKGVLSTLSKKITAFNQASNSIADLEWKAKWYQDKIVYAQSEVSSGQSQVSILSIKASQLRSQISSTRDTSSIDDEIESIKMNIENGNVDIVRYQNQITLWSTAIERLRSASSEFSVTITRSFSYCGYSETKVTDDYSGYMDYNKFNNYLSSTWGSYPQNFISSSTSIFNVQGVDLLSPSYVNTYGNNQAYGAGFKDFVSTYTDSSAFTCSNLPSRPSYNGRVSRVGNNKLWAKDSSNLEWELNFSSCSSLQSATGNRTPRVGDSIIWNGKRGSSSSQKYQYNVKNAICV